MENIVETLLTECNFCNIEIFAASGCTKNTETNDPIKKTHVQELAGSRRLHKQKHG